MKSGKKNRDSTRSMRKEEIVIEVIELGFTADGCSQSRTGDGETFEIESCAPCCDDYALAGYAGTQALGTTYVAVSQAMANAAFDATSAQFAADRLDLAATVKAVDLLMLGAHALKSRD